MKRTTWILVAVLAALAVVTVIVLQMPGEKSSSGSLGEMLVQYDSATVDRLEVSSPSGTVIIAREGGKWMLKSPVTYRADEALVTSAVGQGRRLELKNLVSTNPQKQNLFQVDSTGTLVRIFEGGTEKAAFRVGKPSPSYTETYVRRENSSDVFLAQGFVSYTFSRLPREWRDKTIFKADEAAISSVRFQYGDTTFTLARLDSVWLLDGDSVSASTVKGLLTSLANVQADDFVDSTVTLEKPAALIECGGIQIQFYLNKNANSYTVRTSALSQLFTMQNWRATQLLKRKKDFLTTTS